MHQETLYKLVFIYFPTMRLPNARPVRKHFPKHGPEARLHWACFAPLLFPASMAWSAFSSVHWIVQAIAITVRIVPLCISALLTLRSVVSVGSICDTSQCVFVPC